MVVFVSNITKTYVALQTLLRLCYNPLAMVSPDAFPKAVEAEPRFPWPAFLLPSNSTGALLTVFARRAIQWVGIICLLLCLVGCAVDPAASTLAPTPEANVSPSATLVLWHGWAGPARQTLTRLIDRFNQTHPAHRIFAQSIPLATFSSDLRSAALAGTGPHIVLMPSGWVGGLAADEVLLPLDGVLTPDDQMAMLPATIGSAQVQGADGAKQLYGLPICFDTLALFYNKDNVLTPPETTTDMLDLARGLSEPSASPPRYGLALNISVDTMIGYLYAYGGRVFDDRGQLVLAGEGREGVEKWLTWLAELNGDQRLLVRPYSGVQVDRELKSNQALMTFGWAHQVGEYRRLWGDRMGVAPLPKLAETNLLPTPYVQSDVLAINSRLSAPDQQAAAEFLRFMASPEVQRDLLLLGGLQPARKGLNLDGDDPSLAIARAFQAQAEHSIPLPNTPARAILRDELWQMQRQVLEGRSTPQDAVTETDARLRAALQPSSP